MWELAALEQTAKLSIIAVVNLRVLIRIPVIPERGANAKDRFEEIRFTRDKTRLSTNRPA